MSDQVQRGSAPQEKERQIVETAFEDVRSDPATRWGDVYQERSERLVRDLLPDYRAALVEVLGGWIRSPSTEDGRWPLALHLATPFHLVELLGEIKTLDARIRSGEVLRKYESWVTERAIGLLEGNEDSQGGKP